MSEARQGPALSATTDVPAVDPTPTPEPVTTPSPPTTSVPSVPLPTESASPEPIAARFSQLAAQRREAEARAERLERSLETAIAELKAARPAPTPTIPLPASSDASTRPSRDSYSDTESYESALVSWAGAQAGSAAAAELRQAQEALETQRQERLTAEQEKQAADAREAKENVRVRETQTTWEARRAKAIEVHPDFKELVEDNGALPLTVAMGHVIVTHEEGPEVAYFLAKNPEEAARIAAMVVPGQVFPEGHLQAGFPVPNAVAQAFELGKIAARLGTQAPVAGSIPIDGGVVPSSGPVVVPPSIVVLPAPPAPITGASAAATQRDPNDMSMEEYAAARTPQLLAQRRPGRIH